MNNKGKVTEKNVSDMLDAMAEQFSPELRLRCHLGVEGVHDCHADTPECEIEIVPPSDILDV